MQTLRHCAFKKEIPPQNDLNTTNFNNFIQSLQAQQANLPHGAEIKIPGVGATPVAVSTTLPAAVVQLSQQGKQLKLLKSIELYIILT